MRLEIERIPLSFLSRVRRKLQNFFFAILGIWKFTRRLFRNIHAVPFQWIYKQENNTWKFKNFIFEGGKMSRLWEEQREKLMIAKLFQKGPMTGRHLRKDCRYVSTGQYFFILKGSALCDPFRDLLSSALSTVAILFLRL